jgi:hypothetical protein
MSQIIQRQRQGTSRAARIVDRSKYLAMPYSLPAAAKTGAPTRCMLAQRGKPGGFEKAGNIHRISSNVLLMFLL